MGTLSGSIDSWAWATAAKAVVAARKTDLKDTMVADDASDDNGSRPAQGTAIAKARDGKPRQATKELSKGLVNDRDGSGGERKERIEGDTSEEEKHFYQRRQRGPGTESLQKSQDSAIDQGGRRDQEASSSKPRAPARALAFSTSTSIKHTDAPTAQLQYAA
ncbi:hypothetical protein MKX08_009144 [Trichoderma sp. CBMAI-0020]|nr:hypothetical protein MKX08_009144 [Trichoderma sp. CBMAI-0020]